MAAGIGAIGPVAPQFGQVEHLSDERQHAVGLGGRLLHALHQRSDVVARDLMNLLAAEGRDDEAVNLVLVAGLRAGLVVRLGVVVHEPAAQLLDRRRLAGFGLVESGIAPAPDFGQPVLRQRSGLFDRQFAELADCRLAPHAGVRAVLNHEYLAAGWCNLAQEARNERIPEFHVAGLRLRRVNDGLGEFDLCHEVLLKGPDSRGRLGARRRRTGAVCIAHRDMIEGIGLAENLLQQATSKSSVSPVRMPCSGLKSAAFPKGSVPVRPRPGAPLAHDRTTP